ncbi:MspA family porin [Tsukamurella columbiensis]|nr:MspA family porin [Tsukamurella columbiensis]
MAAAVVAACAVSVMSVGTASAQITPQNPSGPVKGGKQTITSKEGVNAQIALFDLKAKLFPPLAGDNKSRLAYVDGKAEGLITKAPGEIEAATVEVGYVVACGVKDGGFESWIGSNQSVSGGVGVVGGAPGPFGAVGAGVGGTLGLSQNQVIKTAPGAIVFLPVGSKTIQKPKPGESFGVRFGEKRVSIEGCIGSVDAVAYSTLTVSSRAFDDMKTVYSEVMRFA